MFRLIKRFLRYCKPVQKQWWLTAAMLAVAPVISAGLIWAVKILTDEVLVAGRIDMLLSLSALYITIVIAQLLIGYFQARLEAGVTETISKNVRVDLFRHVISLSPGSIKNQSQGDILTRLANDSEHVEYLIYGGLLGAIASAFSIVVFLTMLLLLSWQLTLCALLVAPLIALVSIRSSGSLRRSSRVARRKVGAWFSHADERLDATTIVQAFGTAEKEVGAFERLCDAARRAELKTVSVQTLAASLIELVAAAGGLALIAVGAFEIKQGTLSVGTLIAFLGSVGSLYGPIRSLAKAPGRFQRAAIRSERVLELLDTQSLVQDRKGCRTLSNPKGSMEFRNVGFRYDRSRDVVRNINFKVEPDETVAIVGASGSGKSTLVKLALRFYDPSSGSVLIDGTDVRDVSLDSLRKAMTAVFQEPYIVQGSIADNIRYGREGICEQSLLEAARAAHVTSFSDLSLAGLDMNVGAKGAWLSGGQRQRIAFARAIARDPRILILDEATAAIDSETEEFMQDAMDEIIGRKTTVIIGHRLSSIRRADRIIVVENGEIVETGTPSSLLRSCTRYRELFGAQIAPMEAAE